MQTLWEQFLQQTITFGAIMDPIGVSAMMLGMLSRQVTRSEVRILARQTTWTVVVAFWIVLLAGDTILRLFGIDEHSLKVIGGIVLLMMALEMLGNIPKRMLSSEEGGAIGVIPLGIPMIFGAGLFTTVIILKQQAQSWAEIGILIAAYALNAVAVYFALRYAVELRRILGETAERVVTRLMGLITGAIAVQFIIGGAVALTRHYL